MPGFDNNICCQCSDCADCHINPITPTVVNTVNAQAPFSMKVPAYVPVAA